LEAPLNPPKPKQAALALEDGSYFLGYGFGATKRVTGEIVFSTSMVGYPEALTDPSYQGQILTLTYPLVGNYGVPPDDRQHGVLKYFESETIKATGLIIHELCRNPYHWASTRTLDAWMTDEHIPGIYGVDTRKLTKKLRVKGVMLGILETYGEGEEPKINQILKTVRNILDPNLTDLVSEVTINEPTYYDRDGKSTVVVIDCGVKYGILRNILKRGTNVVRVPYTTSAREIQEYKPDGVIISNGPGDPKKCVQTIDCVRSLIDEEMPIMGICLGTQILALALGGDTYKLKYGHRSQNQPVLDLESKRCYITTQNHGFNVDLDSLNGTSMDAWFMNANDKTVEGIKHKNKHAFALQWHPEAAPGPYDTEFLFDEFFKLVRR
jgi:carbamoyl-phosphate synthase small subunit